MRGGDREGGRGSGWGVGEKDALVWVVLQGFRTRALGKVDSKLTLITPRAVA